MTTHQIGVVVGCFQVPTLHKGYRRVLDQAAAAHEHLLVVIQTNKSVPNAKNPLSFAMRRMMIAKEYPQATIVELSDHPDQAVWSENLDVLVEKTHPNTSALLYDSRDSLLSSYTGKKAVATNESRVNDAHRPHAAKRVLSSPAFRRGVIHVHATRFPIVFPTVDIAIVRPSDQVILLAGKKVDGGKLRFVGGFIDPADESAEAAAKREVTEEVLDTETCDYRYIGSKKVDDWRYHGMPDGIMTTFFQATYVSGTPKPGDDIDHLEWVLPERLLDVLVYTHVPLGEMLLQTLASPHQQ